MPDQTTKEPIMPKTKTKSKAKPSPKAKREALATNDADLLKQALALREDGLTLQQIATKLKVTTNKVGFLFLCDSIRPKDRIKGTPEEVAAAIVHQRDVEHHSWAMLMARTGFSQGKVKKIYAETTGKSANQGYSVVSSRKPKAEGKLKTATKPKAKANLKPKAAKAEAKAAEPKAKAKTRTRKRKAGKTANPSKG